MKRLLPLCLFGSLTCSSCASLFNSRNMKVQVSSAHQCYLVNNPAYKGVNTGRGYRNYYHSDQIPLSPHKPVYLIVARDKEPLYMEFVKDSLRTMVEVRSKLSWVYYLNFAALYPFPGIGFLGDINTPKKWEYDNDVFVDIEHPRYSLTSHSSFQAPAAEHEVANVTYTKGTSTADLDRPSVTFMKDSLRYSRKKKMAKPE